MKKKIVVDVDDVVLDWTHKFRQFYELEGECIHKPFYGFEKAVFDEMVETFNSTVHFGCLHRSDSVIGELDDPTQQILFLSSCGDDENTLFFRENNLKRYFNWKTGRYSLKCLPLHSRKLDFLRENINDIECLYDDAWKNCVDAYNLGIPTIQLVNTSRGLAQWEKDWYHLDDNVPWTRQYF